MKAMTGDPDSGAALLQTLRGPRTEETARQFTEKLHQAFLSFASETEDNVDCIGRIAIAEQKTDEGSSELRPVLKSNGVLLVDMAWALEEIDLPDEIKQQYPEATQQDWEAFTRFTTVLYSLFLRTK